MQWGSDEQDIISGGCRISCTCRGVLLYYSIACEVHVEILGPCPLLMKITPIIEHFWKKLLILPVNPFIFDRDHCWCEPQKQVSKFFYPDRGFHLACHQYFFVLSPAQGGGVPWDPRTPPPTDYCYYTWQRIFLPVIEIISRAYQASIGDGSMLSPW